MVLPPCGIALSAERNARVVFCACFEACEHTAAALKPATIKALVQRTHCS